MNQRLLVHVILLFLSPALSLYQAFQSRQIHIQRWVLIFFITVYGSVILLGTGDGYRHLNNVYNHYVGLEFDIFLSELTDIFLLIKNPETREDPYIHILSYLVGGAFGVPGLFFTIVAFVYAYFFVGSMFRLFKLFPSFKRDRLFFGLALVFLLWKNIEGVSTVRTWTGLWILFYACISYYQTMHKKYILLMFVPPLIHIGYMAMAIPSWFVLFFGVRRLPYVLVFSLSFVTNILNPTAITQNLQETEVGESKVKGYYVEEELALQQQVEIHQDKTWYARLAKLGVQGWAMVIVALSCLLFGAYFREMNELEASLFSIGLLTKALANSTWFLYALASRSNLVAGTFLLAAVLLMWQRGYFTQWRSSLRFERGTLWIGLLVFVPFIIYKIADLIYYTSVFVFFAPFLAWIDSELNISIRQAIRNVFGF